jgi:hypothetical protein
MSFKINVSDSRSPEGSEIVPESLGHVGNEGKGELMEEDISDAAIKRQM